LKTFSVEQRQNTNDHIPKFVVLENHYFEVGNAAAAVFVNRLKQERPSFLDLGGEFPPFAAFDSQDVRHIYKGSVVVTGELLQPAPVEADVTFFMQSRLRWLAASLRDREIMVDARLSVAT
jgi:hypothetical protein